MRQMTNVALVQELFLLVDKHPDLRFSQILQNFGFVISQPMGSSQNMAWKDEFYLESNRLLERVQKAIQLP